MAGQGRLFKFHGMYKKKSRARAKEKTVGGFIRAIRKCNRKTRKCHRRYLVLTRRKT